MSDPDFAAVPPPQDDEDSSTLPPPSPEPLFKEDQSKEAAKPSKQSSVTFSIWPPTQRTRDAVTNRLIETLSTSSFVSKRYGTMPQEEASAAARLIEEEAFATAGGTCTTEGDGIEILNLYSKEISKRMLEMVKARVSAEENGALQEADSSMISTTASEEISTIGNES